MIKLLIVKLFASFIRSRYGAMRTAAQKLAAAKRELQQAERAIRRAPNKTAQARSRRKYQAMAQRFADDFCREIDELTETMIEIEDEFVEAYEAFEEEPPRSRKPRRYEKYVAQARTFLHAGIVAALIELTLAFYQARQNHYGVAAALLISAFVTTVMVVFAHGIIAASTRRVPSDVQGLLRLILWISLGVTILPMVVFFLFRSLSASYLPEFLLGWLQPFNDIALWLATLGLIPTGAVFLGLASHYGWSERLTKRYEQVRRLRAEIEGYCRQLLALLPPDDGPDDPPPSGSSGRTHAAATSLALCLALGLPLTQTACGGASEAVTPATATAQLKPTAFAASARIKTELHFMVDASQSPDPEVTESSTRRLHGQLEETALATGARRVNVIRFEEDGWLAREQVAVELPMFVPPMPEPFESSKLPPHLEAERKKRHDEQQTERERQAYATHVEKVRRALSTGITLSALLPPTATRKQPRCTDISGALKRITQKEPDARHYWIVLSDARHSCGGSQMQPLATPRGEGKTLLLWLPARARESQGQRAEAQFADRVEVLRKVAPWLLVQRADEGDPVRAFGLAEAQAERQAQVTENISQNN